MVHYGCLGVPHICAEAALTTGAYSVTEGLTAEKGAFLEGCTHFLTLPGMWIGPL